MVKVIPFEDEDLLQEFSTMFTKEKVASKTVYDEEAATLILESLNNESNEVPLEAHLGNDSRLTKGAAASIFEIILISKSEDVLLDALKTLSNFAEDERDSLAILLYGGIDPICTIIFGSLTDNVLVQAITLLHKLSKPIRNKKILGKSPLLLALILPSMITSDNVAVRQKTFSIIKSLAELKENQDVMVQQDLVSRLIESLEANGKEHHHVIMSIVCEFEGYKILDSIFPAKTVFINSLIAYADSGSPLAARKAAKVFEFIGASDAFNPESEHARQDATKPMLEYMHKIHPALLSFQDEVVQRGGLKCLNNLLLSEDPETYQSALKCVNTISQNPQHLKQLVTPVIIERLKQLLLNDNHTIDETVASTLFRFSFRSKAGQSLIFKAGIVQLYLNIILTVTKDAQALMLITVSNLIENSMYRSKLIEQGALEIYILGSTFTLERSRRYSITIPFKIVEKLQDHSSLVTIWETPMDGLHGLLVRYIEGSEKEHKKYAIMMISNIINARKSIELIELIKNSTRLKSALMKAQNSGKLVDPSKLKSHFEVSAFMEEVTPWLAKSTLQLLEENSSNSNNSNSNSSNSNDNSNSNSNSSNSNSNNNSNSNIGSNSGSNNNDNNGSNNKKKNKKKRNNKKRS
ncbi:hypothetical protein BGZ76_008629 [Entomortierella beljakovae]|nr:hypothetical protein BGZ76_008629 [Entomortierella beljakovae]